MKKTLIALLAFGGCASAATELVANWDDFSNLKDSTETYSLVLSEGNASVTNGVLTIAGSQQSDSNQSPAYATIDISSVGLTMKSGFTLSTTVSNVNMLSGTSNPVSIFGLASADNSFLFSAAFHTNNADKSQFKFAYDGSTTNVDAGSYSSTINTEKAEVDTPVTLTLTVDDNQLAWYIDGDLSYSSTTKDSKTASGNTVDITGYREQTLTTLAIGAWVGATKHGHMTGKVYDLSIYNGAMTALEVKNLVTGSVPEPTTATLSLLALAGLAARRRRK